MNFVFTLNYWKCFTLCLKTLKSIFLLLLFSPLNYWKRLFTKFRDRKRKLYANFRDKKIF